MWWVATWINLPVSDMLICGGLPHGCKPLYTCVYMYVLKLCIKNYIGLSTWEHASSKGGVCDTY